MLCKTRGLDEVIRSDEENIEKQKELVELSWGLTDRN